MKLIALATLLFVGPVHSLAQDTEPPSSPGPRNVTILVGLGESTGGIGFQAERYFRHERFSVFGGLGYHPSFDTGYPSGLAVAAGARAFITTGKKHRAFLELSVLPIAMHRSYVPKEPEGQIAYGPGFQVGYQYTARAGFTFMGSIGLAYPIGTQSEFTHIRVTSTIGLGYTWRR